MDEWRVIREFDNYQVSNGGRVRNLTTGANLMPSRNRSGLQVVLYENGVAHARAVHRLVADAFLLRYAGDEVVIHIDGNNENNRYYNLRWVTRSFGYLWTQQVRRKEPIYKKKIGVLETTEVFQNSREAAMTLVGLEESIIGCLDDSSKSYFNRHFVTL